MDVRPCAIAKQLKDNQDVFKRGFQSSDHAGPFADLGPLADIRRCASRGCRFCMFLEKGVTWPVTPETRLLLEREDELQGGGKERRTSRLGLCTSQDYTPGFKRLEFLHIPHKWTDRQPAYLDDKTSLINLSKNWITDCLENHPDCGPPVTRSLPTRLLHLQPFPGSQDVRLITSDQSDAATIRYVALSHCWGNLPQRPWLLKNENIQAYKSKIQYKALPLTFRDAIDITRGLGYHYIWIDSLCIIQDDKEDWASESDRMIDVYEGAICTICATSAASSEQGCRVNAGGRSTWDFLGEIRNCIDINTGSGLVRIFDDTPIEWWEQYHNITKPNYSVRTPEPIGNPLSQRAWAFQERELSQRMLNFSELALLWECTSLKASNEVNWTAFTRRADDDEKGFPIRRIGLKHLDPKDVLRSEWEWYWLIEDYTSRRLTVDSDKLRAFAGMAARFQPIVPQSRYLAGIWSEYLPWALAWGVDHRWSPFRSYYPPKVRCPSWSWASVEGRITHNATMISLLASQDDPRSRTLLPEVISDNGAHTHDHMYGTVSPDAQISIQGRVARLRVGNDILDDGREYTKKTWRLPCSRIVEDTGTEVGLLFNDVRDWQAKPQTIGALYCLAIGIDPDEECCSKFEVEQYHYGFWSPVEGPKILAIGLVETGGFDQPTFKRVGLVRWLARRVFDGVEQSVITII